MPFGDLQTGKVTGVVGSPAHGIGIGVERGLPVAFVFGTQASLVSGQGLIVASGLKASFAEGAVDDEFCF